jgi:cytosine/adenosine deaminase-related metal-dependent hydrolase
MSRIFLACLLGLTALAPVAAAGQQTVSLMVRNGLVVTMDAERRVIAGGTVVIDGREIVAVGGRELAQQYQAAHVIDAGGNIVMPGMINLHNHTPMVAFRGIGEYNVKNILFDVMFPLEKELLNRELIYVAARHAAMELALGGVTLVTDMYYHEDEVARATSEVGIRGVLGQTVIGFPVVDAPEPFGGLAYAEKFIQQYKGHELIIPAVAPHAPYTVSPEVLRASRALAEQYEVPMVMHLAEFLDEKELIQERFDSMQDGETIIQYMDRIGALSPRLLAAHVIYVDENDIQILKERGVGVGHNPKANTKGNNGLAPAWQMYKAGVDIGLGTDGPMSSNQMDIFNVMPFVARIARLRYDDAAAFTPLEVVEMATNGGARALDLDGQLGSLEAGKWADLIVLDLSAPNMQPNYDVYATIAHSAYPTNVLTTIVNGKVVVLNRELVNIDREAHQREWQQVMTRVAQFRETLETEPHSGQSAAMPH